MNEPDLGSNHHCHQELTETAQALAANGQHLPALTSHNLAELDPGLHRLISVWPTLSHTGQAIVEAICLQPASRITSDIQDDNIALLDQVIRRLGSLPKHRLLAIAALTKAEQDCSPPADTNGARNEATNGR